MVHSTVRLSVLLFVINISQYISAEIPSVSTNQGKLTGDIKSVTFQGNEYQVDRYLGIPYAKPPTGELRFQPPQPFGPFVKTYNAVEFGASCPQPSYPFLGTEKKIDEDCLFLNVYIPRQNPDEPSGHAVMFFIHGGGFSIGSGVLYDGAVLSSIGNVIVVTINYRLGLLGFLDLDNKIASGNFGLLDQHLALQWVNENIGAFGGDKDRVTIFGESAGSMSVAMQMLFVPNNGLFRNGISQSGAITLPFPGLYAQNNIDVAKYYAKNLSCNVDTIVDVLNCLKEVSSENIIKIVQDAMDSGSLDSAYNVNAAPTIDGTFIKHNLRELLQKKETGTCEECDFFRSINFINGVNGKEGASALIMLGETGNLEDFEVTRELMNTQYVPGAIEVMYGNETVPDVVKKLVISEYTDWENPDDPKCLREQMINIYGDIYFNAPCVEMSRFHANTSNANSYLYNFLPKLDNPILPAPKWVKAANHGDELGPVFGYNFDPMVLFNMSEYTPPEWELELSKRMMKYWSNFAKTGDPNKPETDLLTWPKYDLSTQFYMKLNREDFIGRYFSARPNEFWNRIVPALIDATEHAQSITAQFGKNEEQTCAKDGKCG